MHLEQREISEDLNVFRVPLERIAVALDGLVVLLVRPLQQPVDVPTHVGLEVVPKAAFHVLVGLLLAAQAVQGQAFHGQRLAMLGKFGIRQDLLGELEPIPVLFLFVAFLQRKRSNHNSVSICIVIGFFVVDVHPIRSRSHFGK